MGNFTLFWGHLIRYITVFHCFSLIVVDLLFVFFVVIRIRISINLRIWIRYSGTGRLWEGMVMMVMLTDDDTNYSTGTGIIFQM